MIDLSKLTIKKAREGLDRREFSVAELVEGYLKNIKEKNGDINAYIEVFDDCMEQAKKAQEKINAGKGEMLTGIPFGIKDNICIKGREVTAASKILKGYIAPYDATVIEKLKSQHAIFLGRTNMDEFAHGSSTENSVYGVTKNPHDTSRVAGGSSGGSAASLAMSGALTTLGSDTGGSIRLPAHYCGVVGLKPSYGSVSRYGLLSMGSSFDVIGPFSKNVEDSEIVFNAIKGKDLKDSTSDEKQFLGKSKVIGVPQELLQGGIDEDVLANFNDSISVLKKSGYEIRDISIPYMDYALAVYYILVPAEISSNLARYDGVKFGAKVSGDGLIDDYFKTRGQLFGREAQRRIILGTYVLSAGYADQYYDKAWQLRNLIKQSFSEVFKTVDAILMPVGTSPAIEIGSKSESPLSLYLLDIFTVVANVVGVPAISIPSGKVTRNKKDLPIGIQFLAPHFHENRLFEIGKKFEELRGEV